MDNLLIEPMEGNEDWTPGWIADVPNEKWAEWRAFLIAHNQWELYWDRFLTKANHR